MDKIVKFRSLIVMALLVGLVVFAMMNFGLRLALDNKANTTILQHPAFNKSFGSLGAQIEAAQAVGNNQSTVQQSTTPSNVPGEFVLESTPSSAFAYRNSTTSILTNIFSLVGTVFGFTDEGAGKAIMFTFGAILVITLAMLIWAFIRTGR